MLQLKAFRSKDAGLPDLLNWGALIDEGVVLCKDGSLLGGFRYRGADAGVSTAAERNYLTAMINTYLSRLDGGWALWVDASRASSPGYPAPERSHFPDAISALIDAERRARFEAQDRHYESDFVMILQFLPPLRRESKVAEMFYDDDGRDDTTPAERLLKEFKKRLDDLQDGLQGLLRMDRLTTTTAVAPDGEEYLTDDLVNYLRYCLTGDMLKLRIPDCPMYLDAWLGFCDFWPGDTPKLGDDFISTVSIEGFTGFTTPGLLDVLDSLPMEFRWSNRFIWMDQHEAVADLSKFRRKWQQKVRGFWDQIMKTQKGVINTDALAMVREAEEALAEANSGLVSFGYYSPVIVMVHRDRRVLEEQARYVKREIERKGFTARIETVNCVEAWLGTLPGHTYPNVRRPLVHTLNLADLLPLASVWAGLQENPCNFYPPHSPPLMQAITTGATPFRLNLHVDDLGHTLIFGPTGAGKSTLLATLLVQARRYRSKPGPTGAISPMTITAFDKGRSIYALTSAIGGLHYDIGSDDSRIAVAPLANIDTDSDLLWAETWVETCFHLQTERSPSPQQKAEIHRAMLLLKGAPAAFRSLTDFVATVQDDELRSAISHYTISGPMGHLLDGKSDGVNFSTFTAFEMEDLMKLGNKNAMPVLLYLFQRFEKSLKGQPAILCLDEAWTMLGHPVFREKIREWLKELRKKNCIVIMATQSLSDAVNSGLLDVLEESCPTKILLPNPSADQEGTKDNPGPADLYKIFGLNYREIDLLKKAQGKRHYYYKSPLGRRVFELGLDPVTLAFVAVSDKQDLAQIRRLEDQHGADWPLAWLDMKGVSYAHYLKK